VPTLGSPQDDLIFGNETSRQEQFWAGLPTQVSILNDCSAPNAYSTPSHQILYGISLFQRLVQNFHGNPLPVAGVLAHEWGHQAQFANGWMTPDQSTARATELEADAFSGYYMALVGQFSWAPITDYFTAVTSFGDYDFNSPSHHGTPQERLGAARLGFDTGVQALQTGPLSYTQLHQIFSSRISQFSHTATRVVVSNATARRVVNELAHSEAAAIWRGETRGSDEPPPYVADPMKFAPTR
jgi:hypothetical protein